MKAVSRTEIDPHFILEIEEGQRLRGWITNAYAPIEFMLGDLILRCTVIPEYSHLPMTLPHGATERVKRMRKNLLAPGPMHSFEYDLGQLLGEFEQGHETRNLLAHGFCEYLTHHRVTPGFSFKNGTDNRTAKMLGW